MKKTTAIIMASGFGSRFLPMAKAVNKCMLPLGNKPVIQHIVEDCVLAGIDDIVIVVPPEEEIIQQHFAPDPKLKESLYSRGKQKLYDEQIAPTIELGKRIRFCTRKDRAKVGTAMPVLAALDYINDYTEDLVILNGDAIVAHSPEFLLGELKNILATRRSPKHGVIVGMAIELENRHHYGVLIESETERGILKQITEKPGPEISPHSLNANIGWYIAPRSIMELVRKAKQDPASGEYLLTDVINEHVKTTPYEIYTIKGTYLDCGRPDSWLSANNYLAEHLARVHA